FADYLDDAYRNYDPSYLESFSEEQRNSLMREVYISSVTSIIRVQEIAGDRRRLIQKIEDEDLRAVIYDNFFSEENSEDLTLPSSDEGGNDEQAVQDDSYWSSVASSAAREARFVEAMDAIAMMESPAQQSHSLRNIATCHAYSTTVLDADTAAGLSQIRQRYQ
ncbi:MAG: hypothetical protein AAFU53_16865, partial [Cyanobacteria bacterium J06632_3]